MYHDSIYNCNSYSAVISEYKSDGDIWKMNILLSKAGNGLYIRNDILKQILL